MRKILTLFVVAAACALALAALSAAGTRTVMGVNAKLTTKADGVKGSKGTGQFAATLKGNKLTYKLTFSGLTGPATAAHIHMGAVGKAGNVVVPLCAPCKSPLKGTKTLNKALLTALTKHLLYVNVHTAKNPNGEIRGQLVEG